MEGLASIPRQRLSLEAARTWGGRLGEAGSCRLDSKLLKNFTLTGGSEGPPMDTSGSGVNLGGQEV